MNDVDVLVVGGGISGLSIARLLVDRGLSVGVWERDRHFGGKIQTVTHDGYLLEQAATMVMNFRPEVNQFLSDCNLHANKKPISKNTKRYLVHDGQLLKIPMQPVPMLVSPLWSLPGKLRLLSEPFVRRQDNDIETVAEFIRRRLGKEFLDRAMEPYIAGPLAADAELASAYATLPRLTALEKRYGSLVVGAIVHKLLGRRTGVVRESFSYQHGLSTIANEIVNSPGIEFQSDITATELLPTNRGWLVQGKSSMSEHKLRARQLVLSIPADAAAKLLSKLDPELQGLLDGIEYSPISVVHTGFSKASIKHPLDGNGFLVPAISGLKSTGCLWMSSLFPERAPEGKVLMTNYLGGARQPAAARLDDDRMVAAVMKGLQSLLDVSGDPEMVRIHRHEQGLPLYHGAYQLRMQAITERLQGLPGLHLEANYKGGVSVRDRIACAYTTANRIVSSLAHDSREEPARMCWANATV